MVNIVYKAQELMKYSRENRRNYTNAQDKKIITDLVNNYINMFNGIQISLNNTSVNCINAVYKTSSQTYNFIKVQLDISADSLEDESNVLIELNKHLVKCPTFIDKFFIKLSYDANVKKYSISVKPGDDFSEIIRPCLITSAYTNFMPLYECLNSTDAVKRTKYNRILWSLFMDMVELSRKTLFVHNDFHTGNIIFDISDDKFALIDFGRSYINSVTFSQGNGFRFKPLSRIPAMIDIMCYSKLEIFQLFTNIHSKGKNPYDYSMFKYIKDIFEIYTKRGTVWLRYARWDIASDFFKVINRTPPPLIIRELVIGILYLVLYLNTFFPTTAKYVSVEYKYLDGDDDIQPFYENRVTARKYNLIRYTPTQCLNFNEFDKNLIAYDIYLQEVYKARPRMPGGGDMEDIKEMEEMEDLQYIHTNVKKEKYKEIEEKNIGIILENPIPQQFEYKDEVIPPPPLKAGNHKKKRTLNLRTP